MSEMENNVNGCFNTARGCWTWILIALLIFCLIALLGSCGA